MGVVEGGQSLIDSSFYPVKTDKRKVNKNGLLSGLPRLKAAPLADPKFEQGAVDFNNYSVFNMHLIKLITRLSEHIENQKHVFFNRQNQPINLESESRISIDERYNTLADLIIRGIGLNPQADFNEAINLQNLDSPESKEKLDSLRHQIRNCAENEFSTNANYSFFNKIQEYSFQEKNEDLLKSLVTSFCETIELHTSSLFFEGLMKDQSYEDTIKKSTKRNLYYHQNIVENLLPAYNSLLSISNITDSESTKKLLSALNLDEKNIEESNQGDIQVENEYINKLSTIKTNLKKTLKNIQEDDFLRTNSHFTALVPSIVECLMKIDSIPDRYVTLFESNKAHFLETMEQQNSSKKSTKENSKIIYFAKIKTKKTIH